MALLDLAASDTAEIELNHPKTSAPLGIFITLYGKDSQKFKDVQRKQLNRRLELSQKSRNNKLTMTAEELEREQFDLLVACTKAWRTGDRQQIEYGVDEWLDCTPDNVRKIYETTGWLKEQIDQEIGDRSSFLKQ